MNSREISSRSHSPTAFGTDGRTSSDSQEAVSTSPKKDPQWEQYQNIQQITTAAGQLIEEKRRYTDALDKAEKRLLRTSSFWQRPISVIKKMSCLPGSRARAEARLGEAVRGVEEAGFEFSEAKFKLGLTDVDQESLNNEASYTEKTIRLGDHSIPAEGSFRFGELLKKQIETADTLYFLGELEAAHQTSIDPFSSMEHDFGRSEFELEKSDHEKEELCPPNPSLKQPTNEERQEAMRQFKKFVGRNEVLQIAVASAMHQGIFSDVTKMEAAAPLAFAAGEEVPYVAEELPHLFNISMESQEISAREATLPEKKVYTLQEDTSSFNKKFTLIATRSLKQERIESTTGKKFTYEEQNYFVKTIEENRNYDSTKEISLENSPVLFKCLQGSVTHNITLDSNQWRDVDALEPPQKAAVEEYGNAYYDYHAARQEHLATLNRIASRPLMAGSSSERIEAENKVSAARNRFARATAVLKDDLNPLVRSFLMENTNEASEGRVTFATADGDKTFPERGSFVGGRELQREVTEEIRREMLPFFTPDNTIPADKQLKHDLSREENDEMGNEYTLTLQEPRQQPSSLRVSESHIGIQESKQAESKGNSPEEGINLSIEKFQNFIGDTDLFTAIASTMHQGMFSPEVHMLGRLGPREGVKPYSSSELTLLPDQELAGNRVSLVDIAHLNLEKRESEHGPLFVLTVDHTVTQQLRTSIQEVEGGSVINYERESRFVYTFEKNATFVQGEAIAIDNLPVRVRCRFISIKHQMPIKEGRQ